MLKTIEDRQRNNHTIQQSLLRSWINSDIDVNVICVDEVRQKLKKVEVPSLKNIKEALFHCKRGTKTEKIFANKYILNATEDNVDGYGKRVLHIERDFFRDYKEAENFELESLYNYFAMQLSRSEINLVTAYKRFCTWFGKVDDLVTYTQFKQFYNSTIPPLFSSHYKTFRDGKYKGYHMEVSYLFDDKGHSVAPFFWICEANTFCLSRLKECKGLIPELDGMDLSKIYVCLVSNKELVFLYPQDVKFSDLKKISTYVAINWNKIVMRFVCSTIIVPENGIFSFARTLHELVETTEKQYLHMNNDLYNLKDLQRRFESSIATNIETDAIEKTLMVY